MNNFEDYKVHIQYTFNAFCKVVISSVTRRTPGSRIATSAEATKSAPPTVRRTLSEPTW